jgi:hypothetical protein
MGACVLKLKKIKGIHNYQSFASNFDSFTQPRGTYPLTASHAARACTEFAFAQVFAAFTPPITAGAATDPPITAPATPMGAPTASA